MSKWHTDDKGFHCLGGLILAHYYDLRMPWWKAFVYVQLWSLAWEVKDGLISYETVPFFGGDGADIKDHVSVTIGQVGQLVLDHVIFKDKSPRKQSKELSRINGNDFYLQVNDENRSPIFEKRSAHRRQAAHAWPDQNPPDSALVTCPGRGALRVFPARYP